MLIALFLRLCSFLTFRGWGSGTRVEGVFGLVWFGFVIFICEGRGMESEVDVDVDADEGAW